MLSEFKKRLRDVVILIVQTEMIIKSN